MSSARPTLPQAGRRRPRRAAQLNVRRPSHSPTFDADPAARRGRGDPPRRGIVHIQPQPLLPSDLRNKRPPVVVRFDIPVTDGSKAHDLFGLIGAHYAVALHNSWNLSRTAK